MVERVQSENEQLKKAPGVVSNERLTGLQMENESLKVMLSLHEFLMFIMERKGVLPSKITKLET